MCKWFCFLANVVSIFVFFALSSMEGQYIVNFHSSLLARISKRGSWTATVDDDDDDDDEWIVFQLCTDMMQKLSKCSFCRQVKLIGLGEIRVLKTRSQQGINLKTCHWIKLYTFKIVNSDICATENRHLDNYVCVNRLAFNQWETHNQSPKMKRPFY